MPRFEQRTRSVFWQLNASLSFDRRLAPYDVRQSRAHARALRSAGVLDDAELEQLLAGLDRVEAEIESGEFPFEPGDEDIHMAIERRLTEIAGRVGGKIHTGRSRNDQVATDLAMFVADRAAVAGELLIRDCLGRILALADRAPRLPGCPATPTCSGPSRSRSATICSPGSGCCAATSTASRRQRAPPARCRSAPGPSPGSTGTSTAQSVAAELGFDRVVENSIDGVSNRDFALDYLSAAAVCATHLSRIGAEIVLWSTSEFGFCRPAEEFSSGSSIMPQKMNPDAAELLRAKAPRVVAALTTLAGVMHGLPLAYSKDLQEDKEPLFDAADTIELCLRALDGMLAGIEFDRERMAAAAADEMAAATDIADLLVRRGLPFREAHGVVGGLVRHALERRASRSRRSLPRSSPASRSCSTTSTTRCSARGPGSTRRSRAGGTSAAARRRAARARLARASPRWADGRGSDARSIATSSPARPATSPPS